MDDYEVGLRPVTNADLFHAKDAKTAKKEKGPKALLPGGAVRGFADGPGRLPPLGDLGGLGVRLLRAPASSPEPRA